MLPATKRLLHRNLNGAPDKPDNEMFGNSYQRIFISDNRQNFLEVSEIPFTK